MAIKHANDTQVEARIINNPAPVAVAFLSYESIPCDHFRPELKVVAEKMATHLTFLWLDADEQPSLTEELLVKYVPTVLIFKDGDEIARFEGPYSRETMIERLTTLLSK